MSASTPASSRSQLVTPSPRTDSPGTWRHPRFQEIQQRKNAAAFGDRQFKRTVWNGAALVATLVLSNYLYAALDQLHSLTPYDLSWAIPLLRLYFLANIGLALRPLFSRPDNFTDIPLTPSQRKLLGLDPSVPSPATPGNGYITPPKYKVSTSTPRSQTPQSFRSVSTPLSGSPLSARETSPTPFRTAYSPTASPLLHKVASGGSQERDGGRRLTFSSQSPGIGRSLSLKDSSSSLNVRGTPSPTGRGKGANGLNYKWLYEKGAQSPNRRESLRA